MYVLMPSGNGSWSYFNCILTLKGIEVKQKMDHDKHQNVFSIREQFNNVKKKYYYITIKKLWEGETML